MNLVKQVQALLSARIYRYGGRWRFTLFQPGTVSESLPKRRSLWWWSGVLIFVLALVVWAEYDKQKHPRSLLQFVVLDVGQGTGIYVKTPSGKEILIDTGASVATLRELGRYRAWYDRHIDYIVASHADQDHIGALPRMLEAYQVGQVVFGPGSRQSPLIEHIEAALETQGVPAVRWHRGMYIPIDEHTSIRVLHPQATATHSGNEESLVLLVSHGEVDFLITGDIGRNTELDLVDRYGNVLDVELLLASHHGSKSSSAEEFVSSTSPLVAVVSAGVSNSYGHPHAVVLETFARYGVPVVRTDQDGSIRFLSDGSQLVLEL